MIITAGGTGKRRHRNKTAHADLSPAASHRPQRRQHLCPVNRHYSLIRLIHTAAAGRTQHLAAVNLQRKGNIRTGEYQITHQLADIAGFGGISLQKLLARRCVIEQIAYRHTGTLGQCSFTQISHFAVGGQHRIAGNLTARRTGNLHPAYRRDRRQRLTAEAQRPHGRKLIGTGQFTGGMAAKSPL